MAEGTSAVPSFQGKVSHEAKLKELLHRLTSPEIKLCSVAAKEFARLLKSETGGDLLREYVRGSPNCSELLEALKLRKDQKGMHYVFDLISVILSHGEGLKLLTVERPFAEKHYADLSAKPFFSGLVDYIISGPVVAMIWEGKNVVTTGRKIIGATNPAQSEPGTIRGDFAIDIGRNVIHGSDSVESARKEIALWFPEGPANWQSSQHSWIYE